MTPFEMGQVAGQMRKKADAGPAVTGALQGAIAGGVPLALVGGMGSWAEQARKNPGQQEFQRKYLRKALLSALTLGSIGALGGATAGAAYGAGI